MTVENNQNAQTPTPAEKLIQMAMHIKHTSGQDKLNELNYLIQYVKQIQLTDEEKASGMKNCVSDEDCETAIGHVVYNLPSSQTVYETLGLSNAAIALVGYTAFKQQDNDFIAPVVRAILQKANAEYIATGKDYMPNVFNSVAMLIHGYGTKYELNDSSLIDLGNSVLQGVKADNIHLTSITKPFNALMDGVQKHPRLPLDAYDHFFGSNIMEKNNWGKQILPIIADYQKVQMDITDVTDLKSMAELGKQKDYYQTMNNLMSGISLGF